MILSQFSTEAKNYMRSVLGTQGTLTVLPLEQILETAHTLFFDIDLEHIHAQSKNLIKNVGEPSVAFFSIAFHQSPNLQASILKLQLKESLSNNLM